MTRDQLIVQFGLEDLQPEDWPAAADALLRLLAAYRELRAVATPDGACTALSKLADLARPPRRPRGVTDPAYNAALRLAYETAPNGRKQKALRDVMQEHGKAVTDSSLASALRHVRRMMQRDMTDAEFGAAKIEALLALKYTTADK